MGFQSAIKKANIRKAYIDAVNEWVGKQNDLNIGCGEENYGDSELIYPAPIQQISFAMRTRFYLLKMKFLMKSIPMLI
jgi:hypothetical protein